MKLFPRPANRLYVSCEMREEILRQYSNMTIYLAMTHARELRKETRLPNDVYELELGAAVPLLTRPLKLFSYRRTG